jgi:hypothetical protein
MMCDVCVVSGAPVCTHYKPLYGTRASIFESESKEYQSKLAEYNEYQIRLDAATIAAQAMTGNYDHESIHSPERNFKSMVIEVEKYLRGEGRL